MMRGKVVTSPTSKSTQGAALELCPPNDSNTRILYEFRYIHKITNAITSLPGQGCDVIKWAALVQLPPTSCVYS
ncbi:hypothetical protein E2C01_016241 [Portunus trituberculatus]|uniref:Uncharacterized protein n=1 Tax=Portunus trituberculatus TaxID=210409 RepID=A0A5B7DNK2_PORTR|nr:hypothetical protein [Portunus trituberculatus]